MAEDPHVLVVDGSEADRWTNRVIIERAGYRVTEASSGEEALVELRSHAFDAVVSGYRIGDLDGIGLLEIARRDHPRVCRVFLTGAAAFEVARDAINRAGVHAFLQKPADPVRLTDAVREGILRASNETLL